MFAMLCHTARRVQHASASVIACVLSCMCIQTMFVSSAAAQAGTGVAAIVGAGSGPSGFPARGIELVIPFPAGGAQDVLAQLLAERLTHQMDTPVTVINRPGVNGALANQIVAKAAPDGHVLLLQQASLALTTTSELRANDIARDFTPVGRAAVAPMFLVIDARIPARTPAEWFALARAQPQAYSYGYGAGGGLAWFYTDRAGRQSGVPRLEAKSEAAVVQDMLAGRVSACFCALPSVQAQVRSGNLRVIAVAAETRSALLASVPTLREAGYDGYAVEQWLGVLAPARTSGAVAQRLAGELRRALEAPGSRERLARVGLEPVNDTPQAFAASLQDDAGKWQRTAKASQPLTR